MTIVIGVVTGWINHLMGDYGLHIVVGITFITGLLTLLGTVFQLEWIQSRPKFKELFDVSIIWLIIRLFFTLSQFFN